MTSIPQYVQSTIDPELKTDTTREWRTLQESELSPDANTTLQWLARYGVERNHPRSTARARPITKSGEVLVVTENDTLPKVFGDLIVEGFLSAPVVEPTSSDKSDCRGLYRGWIDLLDIVKAVLDVFGEYQQELKDLTDENRLANLKNFMKLDRFLKADVKSMLQKVKAHSEFPPPVHKGYSLLYCIERMVRNADVRLPIVVPIADQEKVVKGIITDSMVISLLDQNLDKLGSIRELKVKRMLLGLTPADELITCHENDVALTSFVKMYDHSITGMPVLNGAGILVDVIAIRDLRVLGEDLQHISNLFLKVSEFKAEERKKFPRQTPPRPIYVTENDTFGSVIQNTDDGNIHRIFVCTESKDEKGNVQPKPVSIITQRDIMRFLLWRIGMSSTRTEDLMQNGPTKMQD